MARAVPPLLGVSTSLALACLSAAVLAQVPQREEPSAGPERTPVESRALFNGLWDYNAEESVDAATGRPEQGPIGVTPRRSGAEPQTSRAGGARQGTGRTGGLGGGGLGGGGFGSGGGFGGSGSSSGLARARAAALSISRALVRDLMEVPEQLLVTVGDGDVTFVDDLERALTFPTDASKQKYQLSASRFEARASWDGAQLHKEIEGAGGFRMTETYFLSSDASRLFVVIRLGEDPPPDGMPVNGVNRVYDRVAR